MSVKEAYILFASARGASWDPEVMWADLSTRECSVVLPLVVSLNLLFRNPPQAAVAIMESWENNRRQRHLPFPCWEQVAVGLRLINARLDYRADMAVIERLLSINRPRWAANHFSRHSYPIFHIPAVTHPADFPFKITPPMCFLGDPCSFSPVDAIAVSVL